MGIHRASSRASDGAALAKKGGRARCGPAPARLTHGAEGSLQRCPRHYPSSKLFVKSACSKRAALFKARHGASSLFAHAFQASQLASNSASSQNHRK